MSQMIEVALRVATLDEHVAAQVAEKLARILVGFSGEPGVNSASVDVDRWETTCHEHADEVEP